VERPKSNRFIAGDPLRALAALIVVVFHCGALAGFPFTFLHRPWTGLGNAPLLLFAASGPIVVWVFFTLSGYLLGGPFVVAYIEGRRLPNVAGYLRNRALRLLPGMIVVFPIILAVVGRHGSSWGRVAAIPGFVQVYFPSQLSLSYVVHFWTLDDDWAFYLSLPLVMWAAMRASPASWSPEARRRALLLALMLLTAGSIALVGPVGAQDFRRQEWFPMMISAFTPGLALAALEAPLRRRLEGNRHGPRIALALMAAALIPFVYWVASIRKPDMALHYLAGCAIGTLVVGAPLVRQWSDGRCWRALDNRPLQWLGERAYSLYLIHLVVLTELVVPMHRAFGPNALLFYVPAGLAVLIPLTALSFELLERPFMARRTAWRSPTAHIYPSSLIWRSSAASSAGEAVGAEPAVGVPPIVVTDG
jgi:peptidoglycan/LPS O-acetylase OafA/YrhL